MIGTTWAFFFALLAPLIWALMNVFDSYLVKKKVKHILGFTCVAALTNVLLGIILALFLDWNEIALQNLLFPTLAGVMFGLQAYAYYKVLSKHDVSHVTGFIYFYPFLVALLSFMFLNEKLSAYGYGGMLLTIGGVMLISLDLHRSARKVLWGGLLITLLTCALSEFFIKIASAVTLWHGVAVTSIVFGLTILPLLLRKQVRAAFLSELHTIRYTCISELLTLGAFASIFLAMNGLPATVVSTFSALQPLFVLSIEFLLFRHVPGLTRDERFSRKLFALLLVVLGTVLLYVGELS